MNEFFVYTKDPSKLEEFGSVYYPKIKVSWVGLSTELLKHEVWNIEGVYEVRESGVGSFCFENIMIEK